MLNLPTINNDFWKAYYICLSLTFRKILTPRPSAIISNVSFFWIWFLVHMWVRVPWETVINLRSHKNYLWCPTMSLWCPSMSLWCPTMCLWCPNMSLGCPTMSLGCTTFTSEYMHCWDLQSEYKQKSINQNLKPGLTTKFES